MQSILIFKNYYNYTNIKILLPQLRNALEKSRMSFYACGVCVICVKAVHSNITPDCSSTFNYANYARTASKRMENYSAKMCIRDRYQNSLECYPTGWSWHRRRTLGQLRNAQNTLRNCTCRLCVVTSTRTVWSLSLIHIQMCIRDRLHSASQVVYQ